MGEDKVDDRWIGRRVGELRRERGWTLGTLGERVGLSNTQLSRIESGARQTSVGTLIELARAFGLSLSELVADDRSASFHLVRADERTSHNTASGVVAPLSGNSPALEALHLELPPLTTAPEARHEGEEWIFVLAGGVDLALGDECLSLSTGDALHFDARTPHRVRNAQDEPARLLLVNSQGSANAARHHDHSG